ncbi:MAG: hypothetical protein ACREBT_02650 [Thermoplasmata archaeon]
MRVFDPASSEWSIWWFDSRFPRQLDPPLVGRFEGRVGLFFAEDRLNGRPIRVRFVWSRGPEGAPRWEQAFSPDHGTTWETNWYMVFSPIL